jgi:hypothetical protein
MPFFVNNIKQIHLNLQHQILLDFFEVKCFSWGICTWVQVMLQLMTLVRVVFSRPFLRLQILVISADADKSSSFFRIVGLCLSAVAYAQQK